MQEKATHITGQQKILVLVFFFMLVFMVQNQLFHPAFGHALYAGMIVSIFTISLALLATALYKKNLALLTSLLVLLFSTLFSFTVPVLDAPDENGHFNRAVLTADLDLFPTAINEKGEYDSYEYVQGLVTNIHTPVFDVKDENMKDTPSRSGNIMVSNSFIGYIPQAIGINIARLFSLSPIWILICGRLGNSIAAALLTWFALNTTPKYKTLFAVIALLPMQVMLAGSTSIDMMVNYGSLLVLANYVKLREADSISNKSLLYFFLITLAVALCKITYGVWIFLLLTIAKEKFQNSKFQYLAIGIFSFLLISWFLYVSSFPTPNEHLEHYSSMGVDAKGQVLWVLQHPIQFFKLFIKTIAEEFKPEQFNQFGWLSYNCSTSTIVTAVVIALQMLTARNTLSLSRRHWWILLIIFLAVFCMTYVIEYFQWTGVGYNRIIGTQMRYFIPLVTLLPWLFNAGLKLDPHMKVRYLSIALSVFSIMVAVLTTFSQYYI